MASSFSFGFSGGDIDDPDEDARPEKEDGTGQENFKADRLDGEDQEMVDNFEPKLDSRVEPCLHELKDLLEPYRTLHTLHITQTTIPYTSPTSTSSPTQTLEPQPSISLTHRAPFDIRMALMASPDPPPSPILAGVDLVPGTYEGGWQVWEGALDLVRVLAQGKIEEILGSDGVGAETPLAEGQRLHVVELGAGIGLPTLSLFQHLISRPIPILPPAGDPQFEPPYPWTHHFTVSDYNIDVLRLSTTAAFILTWALHSPSSRWRAKDEDSIPEDIEISPELMNAFETDLQIRGIVIDAISGSWGQRFHDIALRRQEEIHGDISRWKVLVLASETLYSPTTMNDFLTVLLGFLRMGNGDAEAYVASKSYYFGIGGNTAELREHIGQSCQVVDVLNATDGVVQGVKREVLKITMNPAHRSLGHVK